MEEAAVMPVPSQEFCLRWNNYHTSLVTSLDSFKNDKDFVDVTLACEGTYLMAHKMLLSACSVFFRDIIKVNPCAHPIIILPQEVRLEDMEKLLRFIYQGEVNVLQENLPRFLKTAEMLKIRGLAEDGEKQKVLQTASPGDESPCPSNSNTSGGECSGTSPKRPRLSLDTTTVPVSTGANTGSASTTNTCSSNSGVSCGSSLVTTNSSCSAPATLVLDGPNTPNNNEDSTHSGNDSDSEMLPVKQEMVELKSCEEFETDGEPFNPDKYLKDGVVMTTTCNDSHGKTPQQPPPPPPGPLMPSYVPPPPIKAQEDSPVGSNATDELSQGGVSLRLMSGGMMMGSLPCPPLLRAPLNLSCDTPPSRHSSKRKSPSVGGGIKRSPPPYSVACSYGSLYHHHQQQHHHQTAPPPSKRSSPNLAHNNSSNGNNSTTKNGDVKSPRYRKSPVLTSAKVTPTNGNNGKTTRQSPRSCGQSPVSPPVKLRHSYSSPDLVMTGSPDENMLPHRFTPPFTGQTGGTNASNSTPTSGTGGAHLMCDICHKTFTSRSNLNKHKRVQHSGEEYTCQLCQRSFKNRYYIKEHTTICASASQKKVAAAVAAAGVGGGGGGGGPCGTGTSPPALPPHYPTTNANLAVGTPALLPAHSTPAIQGALVARDVYKYEPPDDEQPTDLAIHSRAANNSQQSPA